MILETTCFCLICDNCKETYQNDHSGFSMFLDEDAAWEDAENEGWIKIKKRQYCPECFTTDDKDKVEILKSRFKIF
jgi:hypothetical protein